MTGTDAGLAWSEDETFIDAYEEAQARDGRARIEDFLPPGDHPRYFHVLCELVRVELEYGHQRGRPLPVDHYRDRFPALFDDPALASAIAFEEDRLRRLASRATPEGSRGSPGASDAGDEVARAARAYRSRGGGLREGAIEDRPVTPGSAALFRDLHESDPHAAARVARAVTTMPRVGSAFLDFHLEGELGRGAFGRVFLARQGDLAGRLVALKVSADVAPEARSLAQLQHTNIVPIYSLHRSGPLRAVCMPYLGSVTLADVLADLRLHRTMPDSGAGLLASLGRSTTPATEFQDAEPAPDAGPPPDGRAGIEPRRSTAQVETLRRLGYASAILWIGRRLADGLAHAHDRGILHRDLKPANLLLSDGGEPVLLDFNLAADTKLPASVARLGGTLPYMAPEHLDAFRNESRVVDARSDLFALGVVLFELLAGRPPFPVREGPASEILPRMIADREGPAPDLRRRNEGVSPAVEAIVLRCLHPDPDRRYQTAHQLAEDIQRQLDDRPLLHTPEPSLRERAGKWARRHPRLTSTTAVAVLAATILAASAVGYSARQKHYLALEAVASLHDLGDERERAGFLLGLRTATTEQLDEGIALCREAADRYGVLGAAPWTTGPLVAALPDADRVRLREGMGELLYFWARAEAWRAEDARDASRRAAHLAMAARLNAEARSSYGAAAPRALALQRADLAALSGDREEADRLRTSAESKPFRSAHDRLLALSDRLDPALDRAAIATIRTIVERSPQDFFPWLLLGDRYARVRRLDDAMDCYGVAIALRPDQHWAYFLRGTLALDRGEHRRALDDFDRVLAHRPDLTAVLIDRALARLGLDDAFGAEADLSAALGRPDAPTRTWLIRARVRERLGDLDGARRDLAEGLGRVPGDEESWVARGLARLPADAEGALADFEAALGLNPRSQAALQNRASLLSERFGRPEDAIQALDQLLRSHPSAVAALAGRGVLLARLGRRDAALRDASAALALDAGPATMYQVAGIYALASRAEPSDRREALRLLAAALRADPAWIDVIPRDPDLEPLRDRPEFAELVRAATLFGRMGASAQSPAGPTVHAQ